MSWTQTLELLDATFAAGRFVPFSMIAPSVQEAFAAGERGAVRAAALEPGRDAGLRAVMLAELAPWGDEVERAAARELLVEASKSASAWAGYLVLEALRKHPDAAMMADLERALGDDRAVASLWWEEKLRNVAALALRAERRRDDMFGECERLLIEIGEPV